MTVAAEFCIVFLKKKNAIKCFELLFLSEIPVPLLSGVILTAIICRPRLKLTHVIRCCVHPVVQ